MDEESSRQAFGRLGCHAFVCLAAWGCWPRWREFPLTAVGSQTVGRVLGFWQPARDRTAGSPAPVGLPRRKPPPTKVITRDPVGKWWPAGSDICIPSEIVSFACQGLVYQARQVHAPQQPLLLRPSCGSSDCSGLGRKLQAGVGHKRLGFSLRFPLRS